eukprot:4663604-Karenia_brevis.AAC.1
MSALDGPLLNGPQRCVKHLVHYLAVSERPFWNLIAWCIPFPRGLFIVEVDVLIVLALPLFVVAFVLCPLTRNENATSI